MKKLLLSLLILNTYTLYVLSAEHINSRDAAEDDIEEAEFLAVLARYEQEETRKLYENDILNNILNNNFDIINPIDDDNESIQDVESPPTPSSFSNTNYASDDNWLDENWEDEEKDDNEEENEEQESETSLNKPDTIKQNTYRKKTTSDRNTPINKNSSNIQKYQQRSLEKAIICQNGLSQCPAQLNDGTQCSAQMTPAKLTKHCLEKHVKKERINKITHHTCLICGKICKQNITRIVSHIAYHTEYKPFICNYQNSGITCSYAGYTKRNLIAHKKHHTNGISKVKNSSKTIPFRKTYKKMIIDQNSAHQCPAPLDNNTQCSAHMTPAELTEHCRKAHVKTEKINNISHYTCLICNKITSLEIGNIKRHIMSNHTKYKPFACDYQDDSTLCSYITSTKNALDMHKKRNHTFSTTETFNTTTPPNLLDENDNSSYKPKRPKIDDN